MLNVVKTLYPTQNIEQMRDMKTNHQFFLMGTEGVKTLLHKVVNLGERCN